MAEGIDEIKRLTDELKLSPDSLKELANEVYAMRSLPQCERLKLSKSIVDRAFELKDADETGLVLVLTGLTLVKYTKPTMITAQTWADGLNHTPNKTDVRQDPC